MVTKDDVITVLKKCNDPELGIDVWSLGLIYNVGLTEDKVAITMTFTTPMCPYGPMLVQDIKTKLTEFLGLSHVDVQVVFEPKWEPSDELRATLGV